MAETAKTSQAGLAEQALALAARTQSHFSAMPAGRRQGLLVSSVMVLAIIAGTMCYLSRPDWRALYSGLEARDAGTVAQELGAAGITFRSSADQSAIEVPAELLDKARMEVAAKGMPQTGRLGFELFDKPNWVGSEFDEKVNYQRALEGELEHTIGSLAAVKSARVHLALPEASVFTQQERTAKASVMIKLRRPFLEPDQAESIRRLIAGAVDNLAPENVSLVDADGRMNFSGHSGHERQTDEEQLLETKLIAMIEPTVGPGNVRAIVDATYDEGAEERTEEIYDPTSVVTLAMQKSEQFGGTPAGGAQRASGVPGTASNSPAAAPAGAVQGSATAAGAGQPPLLQPATKDALPVLPDRSGGQGQTMRQENGTYGASKRTFHREDGSGRLRKISVALLVNDRPAANGTWKPRTSDELHRLEVLAQAAIGFDPKRGDQVTIENVSFTSNLPEPPPTAIQRASESASGALHAVPGGLHALMVGAVGLLVIVMVLRPVSKQLVATLKQTVALPASPQRFGLGHEAGSGALVAGSGREEIETLHAVAIEQVADHIRRKPTQSTRLLENWIDGPQETT